MPLVEQFWRGAGGGAILDGAFDLMDALNGDWNNGQGAFENIGSEVGNTGQMIGESVDTALDVYSLATGDMQSVLGAVDVAANAVNVANDFGAFGCE